MKRVIGPYVFEGGGAKSLNYQSLAKDLARATLEIPFNIPPYFALIARALGILEGAWNDFCVFLERVVWDAFECHWQGFMAYFVRFVHGVLCMCTRVHTVFFL